MPSKDNTQQALEDAARHHQAGRIETAKTAYQRILETGPNQPEALARLGQSLFALGCLNDAEQAFRRAIELMPDDPSVHHNLGTFFALQNQFSSAEQAYRRAAELDPNDAETHVNLGSMLVKPERLEEAEYSNRCTVELDPDNFETYAQWGEVLYKLARFDEAIGVLEKAVRMKPQNLKARMILGFALNIMARFQDHLGLIKDYRRVSQPLDDSAISLIIGLFLNAKINVSGEGRLIRQIFGYLNRDEAAPAAISARPAGKTMTVGYVSGFLHHKHYLGFLDDIIENHDRNKFIVNVYSDSHSIDPEERVYATKNLSNAELYEKIKQDGVDILIDLNGFSPITRMGMLAMRPSPVMVSWFNVYSTLGLDTVDYLIGDDTVSPPDEDRHYSEKIYRLPGCYLLRSFDEDLPPVREAPIGRNGYCTFGSLGSAQKINIETVKIWARILNAVPDSRFILRNVDIDQYLSRFYIEEFARNGVESSRLQFLGKAPHNQFLETYDHIDIALDTFPYNGGTTTAEALWQGVPVVTFRGKRWVSRVSATLVNAIGYPDWAGEDRNDYVEIAVGLARNPEKLVEMRRQQRQNMASSVLCDAAGFTRKLETAYHAMAREKGVIG